MNTPKLKQKLSALTLCLLAPMGAQAQQAFTLEWGFAKRDNPSDAVAQPLNPPGGVAKARVTTASVAGLGAGWAYDPALVGMPDDSLPVWGINGVWDVFTPNGIQGNIQLSLNASAVPLTGVTYNLKVVQYIVDGLLPGTLSLSPAGWFGGAETPLVTWSNGRRLSEFEYAWSGFPPSGPLSVTVAGSSGVNELIIDRITWTVTGDLIAAPEPVLAQGAIAAALAFFGVWSRRRRPDQT